MVMRRFVFPPTEYLAKSNAESLRVQATSPPERYLITSINNSITVQPGGRAPCINSINCYEEINQEKAIQRRTNEENLMRRQSDANDERTSAMLS